MSVFAIIEIGTSGYLVGKGAELGGMSIRSKVRFALFTGREWHKINNEYDPSHISVLTCLHYPYSVWTFLFGIIVGAGTWRRLKL